jgi:hypothetical protein
MPQMTSNLITACKIRRFFGGHFDDATVAPEPEMVSRLFVAETHRVIAAGVDAFVVIGSGLPGAIVSRLRARVAYSKN